MLCGEINSTMADPGKREVLVPRFNNICFLIENTRGCDFSGKLVLSFKRTCSSSGLKYIYKTRYCNKKRLYENIILTSPKGGGDQMDPP